MNLVESSREHVWVDGVRPEERALVEVKYIGVPARSPFSATSRVPHLVRQRIVAQVRDELRRCRTVIEDPRTPFESLLIITNDEQAASFLDGLRRELGVPGRVLVREPGL